MAEILNFSIKGMPELIKANQGLRKSLVDRRKVNAQAVIVVDRWINENFRGEGKLAHPDAGGWAILADSTIAARRRGKKKELGFKILHGNTAQLRTNWKHKWSARSAQIQSQTPYAKYHQFKKGKRALPVRRIIPTPEQIMPKIQELFDLFVKKAIK